MYVKINDFAKLSVQIIKVWSMRWFTKLFGYNIITEYRYRNSNYKEIDIYITSTVNSILWLKIFKGVFILEIYQTVYYDWRHSSIYLSFEKKNIAVIKCAD